MKKFIQTIFGAAACFAAGYLFKMWRTGEIPAFCELLNGKYDDYLYGATDDDEEYYNLFCDEDDDEGDVEDVDMVFSGGVDIDPGPEETED